MKPKTGRHRKERSSEKDTVVAYHDFVQGQIQGELNGVSIGPGYNLSRIAIGSFIFGFLCLLIGFLVIALRHRHVYLVSWDDAFLGPFFVIMFLLCSSFSTMLLLIAKRRTNQYRKDLAFRPIGDYGVAVVHKSKLTYDDRKKSELKSGTTPHNVRHPGRQGVNERSNQGDYSKGSGNDNSGYKDVDERQEKRDRDYNDGKDSKERSQNRGNRPRTGRRPEGDHRPRPPPNRERQRRPDNDPRKRDDSEHRPLNPDDDKRRAEARKKYEEDKRRRHEEDKRRAELRKQAEADTYAQIIRKQPQEHGVDVEKGSSQYKLQTTVKVSRQMQETVESDL